MTLKDMVEKLRKKEIVEIRDRDNYIICTCHTNSKGIQPYLENEILEWFVFSESVFYGPNFCVLINDEVTQNQRIGDKK